MLSVKCISLFNFKLTPPFSIYITKPLSHTTDPITPKCDVAIIGAGIVGTAISRELKRQCTDLKVSLLEKECSVGRHQSSHNSGVMHCGVYYSPGSLKAQLCVRGMNLLREYCDTYGVPYKKCGKLIVAKDCSEVEVLEDLRDRAELNMVNDIRMLESQSDIRAYARGCRGVKALWCPHTANVDFKQITQRFHKDFQEAGGETLLSTQISSIDLSDNPDYPLTLIPSESQPILAKYAILCGGLQSANLTNLLDTPTNQQFISLKVDYLKIRSKYCDDLKTNVYPVPDLNLPFLGAHFSPQMDDSVLLGPYAVPALKLEGYCNDEVNLSYLSKIMKSCGFRNMILRYFSKCVGQVSKALCNQAQIRDLQQLLPNISYQFIEKGPTSVQCQLINDDGTFENDFVFDFCTTRKLKDRVINCKFTPSPAATSSLAIAEYVVGKFTEKLKN